MQITSTRKNCMEVLGGRLTCDKGYEMPGLQMHVCSRRSAHGLDGGGEIHYLSSCASGRITRVMLADISGSEDVFRRLSCEMRDDLIRSINSIWQDRLIDEMNQQFCAFAAEGGFATASVATYFAPNRSFVMCNIGNPPPLIYRSRDRTWEAMLGEASASAKHDIPPDGVFARDEYRQAKTTLEVGDMIVLYGNGFAQSALPSGSILGHTKLLSTLQDAPHSCPESRLEHIRRLVLGSGDPEEDLTFIVCQVTETTVRLRDNFLAPLRLFQKPKDETQLS